jgi:acetolactate synthase-1/2/3 large subunit
MTIQSAPDGPTHTPARHGGDRVADALVAQRVATIYTLCGGHISPILSAAKARGIRIVDVRDEATAVFAADADARLSGRPGVAAVTAGPGITNTITALKNAQLAQVPLLLIGGAAPTALQGRGALQDIDQRPLVEPHVKRFFKIRRVADLGPAIHEAFAVAQAGVPGPVFVECPVDLLYEPALIRQWYADAAGKGQALADRALRWYLGRHVRRMLAGSELPELNPAPAPVVAPRAGNTSVQAALAALARAERPLAIIGSQALVCADQAAALAQAVTRLGVPVYLSGMARGLLGPDHPLQLRHARRNALREADCVILAGVPCDFRLDYGKHVRRSATLIAANRSARDARLNRRPDVAAIGDAGHFLQSLAAAQPQAAGASGAARWSAWLIQLRSRDAEREVDIDRQAQATGEHVNPIALLRAVDRAAGANALFVADGGDFVSTAAYVLHPRGPLTWLDPGAFGTLGVGAGFALGAARASPASEVWIIFGDGACGYGLVEFDTFVRHGIPVIAIVGNDAGWTQIAREQVKMLHDDVATVLARTDYQAVAEGFGAAGLVVKTAAEVEPALRQARELARAGRPVLVNVWLDKTEFREGSLSM